MFISSVILLFLRHNTKSRRSITILNMYTDKVRAWEKPEIPLGCFRRKNIRGQVSLSDGAGLNQSEISNLFLFGAVL